MPFSVTSLSFPLSGSFVVKAVFGILIDLGTCLFLLTFQKFFLVLLDYQSSSVSFFGIKSTFSFCRPLFSGSKETSSTLSYLKSSLEKIIPCFILGLQSAQCIASSSPAQQLRATPGEVDFIICLLFCFAVCICW